MSSQEGFLGGELDGSTYKCIEAGGYIHARLCEALELGSQGICRIEHGVEVAGNLGEDRIQPCRGLRICAASESKRDDALAGTSQLGPLVAVKDIGLRGIEVA